MYARVKDVMTTQVVAVRSDASYREMAALLRAYRVSGLPVVDAEGIVVGVVSETDLLRAASCSAAASSTRSAMWRVWSLSGTDSPIRLLPSPAHHHESIANHGKEADMSAKPIVAATDGSEESLRAVDWAAQEAVLRGVPLRIVSTAALLPRMIGGHAMSDNDTVSDTIREHRDQALAAATKRAAQTAPGLLIDADQLVGSPAEAVTGASSGALMLVVGSRGNGAFAAMILGSVSRYAATHAACPVVVVREAAESPRRQVGIGIGDLENSASLTFAFEEAALRKASLIAIHSWHLPDSDISRAGSIFTEPERYVVETETSKRLAQLLDNWRAKYPDVPVSQDVVHGHPGRALVGLSARADLVVLGRRSAHHGPASVMHAVLNHAHGPVVTVPS
jgi:nucleotide-binding universal stress UspA family protein